VAERKMHLCPTKQKRREVNLSDSGWSDASPKGEREREREREREKENEPNENEKVGIQVL